jgi:hypothetical protein
MLWLRTIRLTDGDFVQLATLPNLRGLDLRESSASDVVLRQIGEGFPQLRFLFVDGRTSPEAHNALRRRRPDLFVVYLPMHMTDLVSQLDPPEALRGEIEAARDEFAALSGDQNARYLANHFGLESARRLESGVWILIDESLHQTLRENKNLEGLFLRQPADHDSISPPCSA